MKPGKSLPVESPRAIVKSPHSPFIRIFQLILVDINEIIELFLRCEEVFQHNLLVFCSVAPERALYEHIGKLYVGTTPGTCYHARSDVCKILP